MANFVLFNDFKEQIGLGVHNLNTHTLNAYLSNEAPIATDTIKGDIAEITIDANGYTGPKDITNTWSENPAGTGEMVAVDVTWTSISVAFPDFRYVIIYNDDATDRLVGYADYGGTCQVGAGESFTLDFGSNLLTLT